MADLSSQRPNLSRWLAIGPGVTHGCPEYSRSGPDAALGLQVVTANPGQRGGTERQERHSVGLPLYPNASSTKATRMMSTDPVMLIVTMILAPLVISGFRTPSCLPRSTASGISSRFFGSRALLAITRGDRNPGAAQGVGAEVPNCRPGPPGVPGRCRPWHRAPLPGNLAVQDESVRRSTSEPKVIPGWNYHRQPRQRW